MEAGRFWSAVQTCFQELVCDILLALSVYHGIDKFCYKPFSKLSISSLQCSLVTSVERSALFIVRPPSGVGQNQQALAKELPRSRNLARKGNIGTEEEVHLSEKKYLCIFSFTGGYRGYRRPAWRGSFWIWTLKWVSFLVFQMRTLLSPSRMARS
eukprot:1492069-Amphidinium_carterae.1